MGIKIDDPNNPGTEIEVFTPEEIAAKDAEISKVNEALAKREEEVEKYKRTAAEQTENFKRVRDMSDEEKAKFTAEQLETMKRLDDIQAENKALKESINSDTSKRIASDKENALKRFHGGDPKLKEALEKNFDMINLEGNDTETILKRAELAASMEAGKTGRANPLYAHMNGASPQAKDKSKTDEFLGSEKAKEAIKRMG